MYSYLRCFSIAINPLNDGKYWRNGNIFLLLTSISGRDMARDYEIQTFVMMPVKHLCEIKKFLKKTECT